METYELLNKVLGSSEPSICCFNSSGDAIYCNNDFLGEISDSSVKTCKHLNDTLSQMLSGDDMEEVNDIITKIYSGERKRATLEFFISPTRIIAFRFYGMYDVSSDDKPTLLAVTVSDITAEKEAKKDVVISALIENATQPLCVFMENGQILKANNAFSDLCHSPNGNIENSNIYALIDILQEELMSIMGNKSRRFLERNLQLSDGHLLPVEVLVGSYYLGSVDTPVYYAFVSDMRIWREKEAMKRRLHLMAKQRAVSNDLHDSVAQSLAVVNMRFKGLLPKLGDNIPKEAVNGFVECQRLLDDAQIEMRNIIRQLREEPAVRLEDCLWGIEEVMRYAHEVLKLEIIDMGISNISYLEESMQSHVSQVVKEIFTNIHKHADADTVWMLVYPENDMLIIEIIDNGKGFDVDSVDKTKHYGLTILNERVATLGGELIIRSTPYNGTDMLVKVPNIILDNNKNNKNNKNKEDKNARK